MGDYDGSSKVANGFTTRGAKENHFARAMNIKIGIIPLPVYVLLLILITVFVMTHNVKSDILSSIAIMSFSDSLSPKSENLSRLSDQ